MTCIKAVGMKPFKPVWSHSLNDSDEDRRLEFCEVMQTRFLNDPAFLRKIVFSDECNFYLTSQLNKHTIENPNSRLESKSHITRYLTLWAAISWSSLVSLDISQDKMNADCYCKF